MFERYTEQARRTIFFARYEGQQFGGSFIEPVHLILGMLREDSLLRRMVADPEALRAEVERSAPRGERLASSVDMPLSNASKRALHLGADAAEQLQSAVIDAGHLLLGLLRLGSEGPAELLARHGVDNAAVRAKLGAAKPSLEFIPEDVARQRLARLPWTRKEALGHLIGWAAAHHEWIGRALVEPAVVAHGYPVRERVAAAQYNQMRWSDLVAAWLSLSRILDHVIDHVPPDRLATPCRIGSDAEKPLANVIEAYREYTGDIIAQLLYFPQR
jgi:hypothetical protein